MGLIRALLHDCVLWCLRPFILFRAILTNAPGAPKTPLGGGPLGATFSIVRAVFNRGLEIASLDKRSLALFRVGMALTTIWDLGNRARDLKAHYTDAGVFTLSLIHI